MDVIKLKITKIIEETPDVKSFYLVPEDGQIITYQAGQFITIIIDSLGEEIRRSYSIGSSPSVNNQLFITVKRRENGAISRLLLEHYKVGDVIQALAPSGKFTIDKVTDINHYFFFTAGSGIVPIYSLLNELLQHNHTTPVTLINQVRDENNIIYRDSLVKLQQDNPLFEYIQYLSAPIDHTKPVRRLNNAITELLVLERIGKENVKDAYRFYICGPVPFMRSVQFTLKLMGYTDDQIFVEKFVIQSNSTPTPEMQDRGEKKVNVKFSHKSETFTVKYPETILRAAQRQHIRLPYSCGNGQCSTCAVKCTDGNVLLSLNEVLTETDLQNGFVLTCTGYPTTDVTLDYTLK